MGGACPARKHNAVELTGMSFQIHPDALAKIRAISENAKTAENFFDKFVASVGGMKMDLALSLTGETAGGADYLFPSRGGAQDPRKRRLGRLQRKNGPLVRKYN
jgi:hypothetical protein